MAVNTVAHPQGADLLDSGHALHLAMAHGANLTNLKLTFRCIPLGEKADVGFVNEVDMVGEPVHALPVDWLLVLGGGAKLCQLRAPGVDNGMAEHTLLHRRDGCRSPLGDIPMAEHAVKAYFLHMLLVGELDGLHGRVSGTEKGNGKSPPCPDNESEHHDRHDCSTQSRNR